MSCPMGFGELNIPSSRAFWDDCDEDEFQNIQEAEKLKLKFESGISEDPFSSDVCLVIEGLKITDFCQATLLSEDSKRICSIPTTKPSGLYFNSSKGVLLAVLEEDLTNSGEITDLLVPYAQQAKQVLTISIRPKVDYKSEEIQKYNDEIAIVRSVKNNLKGIVELEPPNFIAGVTAGIAVWREQSDLPVSSYVIYSDTLPLDATAAQPVIKLLKKLEFPCQDSYKPRRKDLSHLYS